MYEINSLVCFLYVIGLFGQPSHGYHFSKNANVPGSPINHYRNRPQFFTSPTYFGFHKQYGSRPLSTSRHTDIKNVNTRRQHSPITYHIIVYDDKGIQSESLYSDVDVVLNQGHDKNVKPKPVIKNENVHKYNQRRPVTGQNIFSTANIIINEVLPETVANEQLEEQTTTEPVAILGKPVIVPMSELNADEMEVNSRSKNTSQKQCVQDCQSSSSYRPICGTDNVTYFNEEKFLCAQKCEIAVFISKRGPCS